MAAARRAVVAAAFFRHIAASAGDGLAAENEKLRERLKQLEEQLGDEAQHAYVVIKGMISDEETVFQETMEIDDAKRWCNANAECKGFTFGGDEERPDDEVTVTFKGGTHTDVMPGFVSYVKETSVFGAVGDAAMQLEGGGASAIVAHGLTFQACCIVFAVGLAVAYALHRRRAGRRQPLLPQQLQHAGGGVSGGYVSR